MKIHKSAGSRLLFFCLLFCFISSLTASAQELFYKEEFYFKDTVYTVSGEHYKDKLYEYRFVVTNSNAKLTDTIKLISLKIEVFKFEFVKLSFFSKLDNKDKSLEILKDIADHLFVNIIIKERGISSTAPISGYLYIENPNISVHDYFGYTATVGRKKAIILKKLIETHLELLSAKKMLYDSTQSAQRYLDFSNSKLMDSVSMSKLTFWSEQEKKRHRQLISNQKIQLTGKRLTSGQKNRLLKRGVTNENIEKVFPDSLGNKKISKVRKSNHFLLQYIEDYQDTLALIKGILSKIPAIKEKAAKILETNHAVLQSRESLFYLKDRNDYQIKMKDVINQLTTEINLAEKDSLTLTKIIYEQQQGIANLIKKIALNKEKITKLRKKTSNKQPQKTQPVTNTDTLSVAYSPQTSKVVDSLSNLSGGLKTLNDSIRKRKLEQESTKPITNSKEVKRLEALIIKDQNNKNEIIQRIKQNELLASRIQRLTNEKRLSKKRINQKIKDYAIRDSLSLRDADSLKNIALKNFYKAKEDFIKPVPVDGLTIDSLQIEIYQSNIKSIILICRYNNEVLRFVNLIPIPFSTLREYNISEKLYSWNHKDNPNEYLYWIRLSDVIKYVPKFYPDAEDYSPADTALFVKPETKSYILRKDKIDKILDARIYTDLVGLDNDNPNGLIQFEVSRKLILRPKRDEIILFKRPTTFFGWGNYVEPIAALTKFESNNKELSLTNRIDTIGIDSLTFKTRVRSRNASVMDLLRYSNFQVGGKMNLVRFDISNAKSSFLLDFGVKLIRTRVKDSVRTVAEGKYNDATFATKYDDALVDSYNVNSLMSFIEIIWQVKPDYRFGLTSSYQLSHFDLKTPRFNQVINSADLSNSDKKSSFWLHSFKIDAFIRPSDNSKIFFRANYFTAVDDLRIGFFQAQIGYAFNILKHK